MVRSFSILLCVMLAAGCVSTDAHRREQARGRADVERLEVEVARLREQVVGLSVAQEDLGGRVDVLSRQADADRTSLADRQAQLERSVTALDRARATDRQAIIDTLSKNVTEVMRRQPPPGPALLSGVEHVVERGQTLSEIASAYNVRADLIIKANNIKDPNTIREGQKLLIPE